MTTVTVGDVEALVWEFPLDWSSPPLDRYEWLTDVIASYNNTEQRSPIRTEPRRTIEASFTIHADRLARLDAQVFSNGSGRYLIPYWPDCSITTASGAMSHPQYVYCDTANREFKEDDFVLVGNDLANLVPNQISSIQPDYLVMVDSMVLPAGVRVYPARLVRIVSPIAQSQLTAGTVRKRPTFMVDDQPFFDGTAMPTSFGGLQVLTRYHNWTSEVTRSYARSMDILDNAVSLPVWVDKSGFPAISRANLFQNKTRADRWAFQQWLYSVKGRLTPFWKEDRETVMRLSPRQSLVASATLHVLPFGFADSLQGQPQRVAVVLRHRDGSIYNRNVLSATIDGGSGDELIVLDATIPGSVAGDWLLITYMEKVRLTADAAEIAHMSADVSQVALSFTGVRQ